MEMPCAHATTSSCPQHPEQHRATDRQHRSKPTKTITAGASPALLLEQKCARWELSFWRKPSFCRNVGASRQGDREAPTRLPRRRLVRERSCSLEKGQPISTSRRTSSRKEAHAKVKDEKKITERGWSECSGHGEEFQRLPEKEALVFLFGQKKKITPYLLPAAVQSSTFLRLKRGSAAPRRGGTHSRKGLSEAKTENLEMTQSGEGAGRKAPRRLLTAEDTELFFVRAQPTALPPAENLPVGPAALKPPKKVSRAPRPPGAAHRATRPHSGQSCGFKWKPGEEHGADHWPWH